jgi:NAD(P)-dependent dehydrogenase (short-subunit alcohol dehydrogenase family)
MSSKEKRVVVISGGMGAVGSALATLLTNEKYQVILTYFNSTKEECAKKQSELGADVIFVRCDVRDPQACEHLVEEVLKKFGSIDVCIHAAVGAIARKQVARMSLDEFKEQFETGLFGAFALCTAVTKVMKEKRAGVLIGITTSAIEHGEGGAQMGAYSIAKYALRGLLRELSKELAADGISVFAVAPDLMKTKLNADLPDMYLEFAKEKTTNKKLQVPEDVARSVVRILHGEVPAGSSVLVSSGAYTPL